ncbi:hypothetical protein ACTXMF_10735 [Psychrobacter celer]|uniref:hypothetical protein n=1 Tax=Psychrobacter TaxID=497 RepID=UPI001788222A|nr:hypothetical protein [Psychrobacter sp. FME13]MBE0440576.1 hypothetical protein [Psychrobacter sp. FME13]
MTFDDLLDYFDGQSYRDISKQLGVPIGQLTYYKQNGIPEGRQAIIELQTNGDLKADIPKLIKLEEA